MRRALPLLALAACTPVAPQEGAEATLSMANPASVYCTEQGGEVEIRDEEGGQVGYCRLPDGRVIEEWAFWRQANGG